MSRGRHGAFVLVSLLGSILSWESRTVDAQYLISLDTLDTCLRWLDGLESGFTRNGLQGLIKEANATFDGIEVAAADGDPYPLCLGNITGDANDWPQMTVLAHPKVPTGTTQGELKADNTDEELNHPEQGTIVAMSRMINEANDHVNGGYYTFYYHFNTSEALLNGESWTYSPLGAPKKEYIAFSEEYMSENNQTKIFFCACTLSHYTSMSSSENPAQQQVELGMRDGAVPSSSAMHLGIHVPLLIFLLVV